MPRGLLIVDGAMVGIGILLSVLFFSSLRIMPLLIFGLGASIFNLLTGITNSPDNIHSKFRQWLFGSRE